MNNRFLEFYDLRKTITQSLNPNDMLRNPWEYQLIMGSHLQKPKTEKEISSGDGNGLKWGCCGMQGWRTSMEDAHIHVVNTY